MRNRDPPGPRCSPRLADRPRTAAADLPASVERGKELLAEGDKLADSKETTEAVLRYKQAFEQLLPGLRQLRFKPEVKRDVTKREDLRAFLIKEIDEEMTPAEFRTGELGLKALGLHPPRDELEGGDGQGLLRGDRRLLRPPDQDHAPDQGARRAEAEEAGLPRVAPGRQEVRASTRTRTRPSSPTS